MIKVSVIYPNDEGSTFDMDYYLGTHIPLCQKLLGTALLKAEVDEGLSGTAPDSRAPFVAAVHMYFESTAAFYEAFGPNAKAIRSDVPNYTSIKPMTQVSKVR
ncbi:MAG: EthD family reductase [Proteobacteria bacterium]|nr:EthD family reductase [Pseudomonadota bacterium]